MPEIRRPERKRLERDVVHEIREDLGLEPDLLLWRNNKSATFIESRFVVAGLPDGSSDLIGCLRMRVVFAGRPVLFGRLFCLEAKRPGGRTAPKRAAAQAEWAAQVRLFGGFYAKVESKEEARAALERARRGESQ